MKNLHDPSDVAELRERLARLPANATRQWGRMTPAQAMAHCASALEIALGDRQPKRMLIGRVIGRAIRPLALGDDKPMKQGAPTSPDLVVADDRDLETERQRLDRAIERFATAGPEGCTTHPHTFFGPLTSNEWAVLMYKHIDHHLRQFGA